MTEPILWRAGDLYESCGGGHPVLCTDAEEDDPHGGLYGISLVDGTFGHGCSKSACAPRRLTLTQAVQMRESILAEDRCYAGHARNLQAPQPDAPRITMTEQTSFLHLVAACRDDKERAELSLLLAHATLGLAATMETHPDKKDVPLRMMHAAREAARALAEQVLGGALP